MTSAEKLAVINQVIERCRVAPFYRNRLPDKPLAYLEDFKNIPLTTKEDLRQCSLLGLICVPKKELYQYHESFGTSGTPVSAWLTKEDLRRYAKNINSGGLKFTKEDIVLIRFPYAISSIAHMVHLAAQSRKACVIPASSRSNVSPFPRIISLMQKLEVTVLACLPLQALLLAETAELMGYKPAKDFPNLRAILTAGEPLTSGKRRLLESIWDVPITDNFGMTEIGSAITDCEYGRAHPTEDDFIFEILKDDLKTDVKPGEVGHLVITTLKRKGTPVIRFWTEDRARIVPEECPCGQRLTFKHHGRKKDIISINNRIIDIWDLDEIVSHFPCRRFWVVGPNLTGLQFVVEEEKSGDTINTSQIQKLEEKYGFKLEVEIVPKGSLYDRSELSSISAVGKPRYIYSAEEMQEKTYLKSTGI